MTEAVVAGGGSGREGAAARYGFVLDTAACTGCHACTVACVAENGLPPGSFYTWVKQVEVGLAPATRRVFQVNRCQHCDRAPCVSVCPTRALFKRPDGIIDFDTARCTGCQACMQACPYDAIHLDPVTRTVAKCHFCAHRVDAGLLPACAVACPTGAIIAGDLNDAGSHASVLAASANARVRKPEQQTRPKVSYLDPAPATLDPLVAYRDTAYAWAPRPAREDEWEPAPLPVGVATAAAPETRPSSDGAAAPTDYAARLIYDVERAAPWGTGVALALWLRTIGAGTLLTVALLIAFGEISAAFPAPGESAVFGLAAPAIAWLALLLAGLLSLGSLRRLGRAWRIFLSPNPRSWLVWGAWFQVALVVVAMIWPVAATAGWVPPGLTVAALAVGLLVPGSGALTLGQLEGRDLWQTRLQFWHALAQALVAGSAMLLLAALLVDLGDERIWRLGAGLAFALALDGLLAFLKLSAAPRTPNAAESAFALIAGYYRDRFWGLVAGVGTLLPLLLLVLALASPGTPLAVALPALASTLALLGRWFDADLWVRAGQFVPLS